MKFPDIAAFISDCESCGSEEIGFCDSESFDGENINGAAPGGYLNPFGYYVIGSTIGGNTIVISDADPRVLFADHTWYGDDEINYQDHAGDGEWHTIPLNADNVRHSLYELAANRKEFLSHLRDGTIDRKIEAID